MGGHRARAGAGAARLSQAFHVMRSGVRVPVHIDLPLDVQLTEIEFDDENVFAVAGLQAGCGPAKQIEKALQMLNAAERPLIVAGGGVINADACELLVAFAGNRQRACRADR